MIDPGMIDKELMEYFRELSPRERRLMFEKIEGQDEELMEFCRELYRDRYTDPKNPDRSVDNWLWKLAYLPGLYSKRAFFRMAIPREAAETIKDLHLEDTSSLTDIGKTVLYLEFRNAAKRYLSTCESDGYGNTFFGLKKSTPEDKKLRATEDIWSASRWLARKSGEEDRLEIWCMALRDELFQYDENCESYYNELESKF